MLDKTFVILQSINYLNSLNSLDTLTQFVQKLPNALKGRWVKKSVQIENATNSIARLSDFVSFVQAESEEANSVFGLRSFGTKNPQSKVKTLPRHIREGLLIRRIIASHLCTSSGLPVILQRIEKTSSKTRIVFERYYSFFHQGRLSSSYVIFQKQYFE